MSANTIKCKHCGSDRSNRFSAEVAVHFPEKHGLSQRIVWVFPELHVCFDCGFAEFMVPDRESKVLRDGVPSEGSLITKSNKAA